MSNIAMTFWRWLFMRSSQNAAHPNPGTTPYSACTIGSTPSGAEPIELAIEEEAIVGSTLSLPVQNTIARGPNGELIRSKKNYLAPCSCGHFKGKFYLPSKDGSQGQSMICKCYVCDEENKLLALNGHITIMEAEWRSLVCHQCVRVTVSGRLCCPRHSIAVPDANGTIIYLGPEEQQEFKRKQLIQNSLKPLLDLFFDQVPQPNIQKEDLHE